MKSQKMNDINILTLKFSQPKSKYINISVIWEYIDLARNMDIDII